MSPEQAAGKKGLSVASDVYSLGAILYELLTGRPPFRGENTVETLMLVMGKQPEPPRRLNPQSNRDLEIICLKCLEKDAQRRYPSAEALAEDLERWLAGEPIQARPVGRLEKGMLWVRRNPVVAGLAAAVAAALLAGASVSTYFAIDAAGQAELARDNAADAETKAKAANASAAETRRVLGEFSVTNGVRLEEQGDLGGALLWYAEQLWRDAENEEGVATARLRLTTYLRYAGRPTPIQVLAHEEGAVHAAFSPDGRRMLTTSRDGTTRFLDTVTGQPVWQPIKHQSVARYAAFRALRERV
jgi:hypothetical protein